MTPKEKAEELANKFVRKSVFDMNNIDLKEERLQAKKSAFIAVDEIIRVLAEDLGDYRSYYNYHTADEYWQEVKQEIEKL
jgi:hypothetical protein